MSIPRRSTGPQLEGLMGKRDPSSKPTAYSTANWGSRQTSSPESSKRATISLKYSPTAAHRVKRLLSLSTQQPRAAQPHVEPRPPGKCRDRPHRMNMSITARKTIKTISDDISCERTQKKRKLNALLVDQRRQEKVSRSSGKPKETPTSYSGYHADMRPPSPGLIDPSSLWSINDFGLKRTKVLTQPIVSPRPIPLHVTNPFTRIHHTMNKFGDDDTQKLYDLPASSNEGFGGTEEINEISPADFDFFDNRDSRPSLFEFGPVYGGRFPVENEHSETGQHKCSYPGCGRQFRDLKAHMLTHETKRPEKCPIKTCDYHTKGFARKYDKNRHTLTHFKRKMVCGFCPGVGSAAEKSFNRADAFKRHLTLVHGVEQTPPDKRKRNIPESTGVTNHASITLGKCSVCTRRFSSAQFFYDHLDDCVLRNVLLQQQSPRGEGSMERNFRSAKRKYVCTLPSCGKTFAQKTHLEIHTRAHSGADYNTLIGNLMSNRVNKSRNNYPNPPLTLPRMSQ